MLSTARGGRSQPSVGRRRGRRGVTTVAVTAAAMAALLGAPAAHAVPTSETWAAELSVADGDDANVVARDGAIRLRDLTPHQTSTGPTPAEGELVLPPRRLSAVSNQVTAALTAEQPPGSQTVVSVRGIRSDGTWSQWTAAAPAAPAVLPEPTFEVQVRVTLVAAPHGAGPAVRQLWLTADRADTPDVSSPGVFATRVFATRIGLVGHQTANGHQVAANDRYAALPSRRGLSARDAGDYTVEVCASPVRCTWTPVWDVGPWNTTDDYWNPAGTRQSFADLPTGRPEAQAAFTDGYNNGRDGFGRQVSNPAGIDLADGTFRDDLGLTDNTWVTVSYLWTATGPTATAPAAGPTLAVRAQPAPDAPAVGVIAPHAQVRADCALDAPANPSRAASPSRWLRLGASQFVPAESLETHDVPHC
jgi:hypothetical protein